MPKLGITLAAIDPNGTVASSPRRRRSATIISTSDQKVSAGLQKSGDGYPSSTRGRSRQGKHRQRERPRQVSAPRPALQEHVRPSLCRSDQVYEASQLRRRSPASRPSTDEDASSAYAMTWHEGRQVESNARISSSRSRWSGISGRRTRLQATKTYILKNRSDDRVVLIEHPCGRTEVW